MERYLRVNLLGPGPCLMKKEFTGSRSHKGWETLVYHVIKNYLRQLKSRISDCLATLTLDMLPEHVERGQISKGCQLWNLLQQAVVTKQSLTVFLCDYATRSVKKEWISRNDFFFLDIIIIIIIIIIIFIYCSWVVTRWQWLFYMYTEYEIGYY